METLTQIFNYLELGSAEHAACFRLNLEHFRPLYIWLSDDAGRLAVAQADDEGLCFPVIFFHHAGVGEWREWRPFAYRSTPDGSAPPVSPAALIEYVDEWDSALAMMGFGRLEGVDVEPLYAPPPHLPEIPKFP